MGVVDVARLLGSVPRELPQSRQHPELRYELADDLVATPTSEGGMDVRAAGAVGREVDDGTALMPVYRRGAGGGAVVPTGRVLVRFAEGDRADAHREELAAAGYQLEQVLGYAPQAGWARAVSGSIADTLGHLHRLEALPGVENVEVQMVGEVARR